MTTNSTSNAQHTPGPWELSYDQGSCRDIMTKDARVCTVRQAYVTRETYHANARLIAAAPELLAALKLFQAEAGRAAQNQTALRASAVNVAMRAAQSAIAKAEGSL